MADIDKSESISVAESSTTSVELPITALDATVLGENANSYCTVNEADIYIGRSLWPGTWEVQTEAVKEKALMYATQVINNYMAWLGSTATSSQALAWPRYGITDSLGNSVGSDEIPEDIKHATVEVAISFIAANRLIDPDTSGFKFIQVEQLKAVVDKRDRIGVFTKLAWSFLKLYGTQFHNAPRRLERV